MRVENVLTVIMAGLTIIGFMIAVGSYGRIRMFLSYLLASLLLVFTIVVFIHGTGQRGGTNKETVKKLVGEEPPSRLDARKADLERIKWAGELKIIAAQGSACANSLLNKDLRDESVELQTLVGRASGTKKRVEAIKQEVESASPGDSFLTKPYASLKEGIQLLSEASQFYFQYYYSEDSAQELSQERMLRLKARNAYEKFQTAASLLGEK